MRPDVSRGGIYHNPTLWLISISWDGTNWITIADKNLGASQVWNDGDTLSQANCGNLFQRGNNHWFPRNDSASLNTSPNQVDASNYWPGNYYSSSTFITDPTWDTSQNTDLWWDVTDTLVARQWPCPSWWHIPTSTEVSNLLTEARYLMLSQVLLRSLYSEWFDLPKLLKLPVAGRYNYDGTYQSQVSSWQRDYYQFITTSSTFSSISSLTNDIIEFNINGYNDYLIGITSSRTSCAYAIRPFKNTPVIPSGLWWECLAYNIYWWSTDRSFGYPIPHFGRFWAIIGGVTYQGTAEGLKSRVYDWNCTNTMTASSTYSKGFVTFWIKFESSPSQSSNEIKWPICKTWGGAVLNWQWPTYDCIEYYDGNTYQTSPSLGLQANTWYHIWYWVESSQGDLVYYINWVRHVLATYWNYASVNDDYLFKNDTSTKIHIADYYSFYDERFVPWSKAMEKYFRMNKSLFGY